MLALMVGALSSHMACQVRYGDQTTSNTSTLTVIATGPGTGSITSADGGISACTAIGGTCSHAYINGTSITLTPTPTGGSTFGWSTGTDGASSCSGTGLCTFTITGTASVLAIFTGAGGGTIPASPTFSIDVVSNNQYPTTINHGQVRIWDTPGAQWSFIETSNNVFSFTLLDQVLNEAAVNQVHTAQMGLARTPNWASSNTNLTIQGNLNPGPTFSAGETLIQNVSNVSVTFVSFTAGSPGTLITSQYTSGTAVGTQNWIGQNSGAVFVPDSIAPLTGLPTSCSNYFVNGSTSGGQKSGQCYPTTDVASDGSGTDLIWRNWVAAIVTHVNQAGYILGTGAWAGFPHAGIKYWEIWNEPYATGKFWSGSYDQLIRYGQDAYCIIKGTNGAGIVQASPSESCAAVRASVTSVANCCDGAGGPGDPTSQMVMPSYAPQGYNLASCYLYCTPQIGITNTCGNPATSCISGRGGASVTDRINFHAKPGANLETAIPSQITAVQAQLLGPELAKPIDDTEAGFSATGWSCPNPLVFATCYTDPNMQGGYIPRMYMYYYFSGVANDVWYNWTPSQNGMGSATANNAYNQVYNWMFGSTPPSCTHVGSPPNAVYTCTMTSATSVATGMIWDTSQSCGGTPSVCSTSTQTVATHYQSYIDITGTKFTIPQAGLSPHQVKVSITPVLLQDTP